MNTPPIVQLEKATKTYQQGLEEVHAVDHLSLEIQKGSFAALCGPSGSGKTTVLNLIGGLDIPSSGTVRIEGRNLADLTRTQLAWMRRDRIGFVFQAYNLVPVLTAYENAEFVLALQGCPDQERRKRVMATGRLGKSKNG